MSQTVRRAVLYKLLRQAGLGFSVDSFANRLRLQKATYLLVAMGAPLDYHYNWYLRGPYSPSLANDLFAIAADKGEIQSEASGINFGRGARQKVDSLKSVLESRPNSFSDDVAWFEALASVAFLKRRGEDLNSIASQLGREKGFSVTMVTDAERALANLDV